MHAAPPRLRSFALAVVALLAAPSLAVAQSAPGGATADVNDLPHADAASDVDALDEPDLPDWLELNAEYRMRMTVVDPLDLAGSDVTSVDWTEHRGRLHFGLVADDRFAIRTRIDLLDQVLWGDNGRIGRDPEPVSGASVTTHQPNAAGVGIGLIPGADPLDRDSYVPALRSVDPVQVDLLYADVTLPIGLLRVGRQPALGQGISGHDGERGNRWGVASWADAGDRILFATKLDEAVRLIRSGGDHEIDGSMDRGVFLAGWYELADQGDAGQYRDNLRQLGVASFWRQPWFGDEGSDWHDVGVTVATAHVGGDDFATSVWAIPVSLQAAYRSMRFAASASFLRGETREISEGFAELARTTPTLQTVRAQGAQAIVEGDVGPVTLTLQFDYASGDDDPRPGSDLTVYSYPRDYNVGLLLFERILAYSSARSAAVGVENLRNLDASTFPLTEVETDGRFTNAVAVFPQALVQWVDTPEHGLHTRFGVLMAWPDAGVVDPVATVLARDGERIDDDAVNYEGGDPGSYYGTELDGQVAWTFRRRFIWTVESAVLLPGDALEDENGDAVTSWMVENRFEVLF